MAAPNLLVYLFYILQMLIYKKRIVSQKLSLPPLKGEVEFHHVSDEIPEGSRGRQQDLKLSESYFVTFYCIALARKNHRLKRWNKKSLEKAVQKTPPVVK